MNHIAVEGTHEKMGFELGCQQADAIRQNIALREREIGLRNIDRRVLSRFVHRYGEGSTPSSLKMMEGLSRGSGVPFESILRFNALQDLLSVEECTSFAAVGKATPDGNAVLLKNRDKRGFKAHSGQGYFENRIINTAVALKTQDGNVIVGVTNAGSAGINMGLNKYGVAAASNTGRTSEISAWGDAEWSKRGGTSGRPQMFREGLECTTAKDAVDLILRKLTASPMGTPGIIFVVDPGNVYVIEGSLSNGFAVQHITDGATCRSNHFLLLDQVNDEKAVSPICRKIRATELVEKNFGSINREKLMEFSMDHENGPYKNSICVHGKNLQAATSSACIMEMNRKDPQKSRISVALGSPCWAWRSSSGHFTFQMDDDIGKIKEEFIDGSSYKEFLRQEPRVE